jgi:RNA-directed DNA polymerase
LKCKGYLRFVDDFLLFNDSKSTLWEWRADIIEKLGESRLILHEDSAVPYPVKAGIPFLGFVLFPEYRLLKRKKGIAYRRRLKHLVTTASSEKIQSSLVAWINHASYGDTYRLRAAILDYVGRLAQGRHP